MEDGISFVVKLSRITRATATTRRNNNNAFVGVRHFTFLGGGVGVGDMGVGLGGGWWGWMDCGEDVVIMLIY